MESTYETRQLVRSYSLELEETLPSNLPTHDVRRVLVDNERQARDRESETGTWRSYYEPWKPVGGDADPTTRMLKERAVLLSHAWKVFRETIPKSEQDELNGREPSVEGLVGMVDAVASSWQNNRRTSKTEKYIRYFTKFCQTLDSHSYMLEVLPDGNEYVSLFTGSLKTLIHASSNYEKIASGLGEALSRISAHVAACEKELVLHPTKDMQHIIAKFYAHVFLFLEDTMEWYLKKPRFKIRDAFREDFYDHFEKVIQNIENLSIDVLRAATQSTMGEIRQIRYTTQDIADSLTLGQLDVRVALEGISKEQADARYRHEQLCLDLEQHREERRLLEHNIQMRIEAFSNNLISQIIYTGVRQELLVVAQRSLDDRNTNHHTRLRQPLAYIETRSLASRVMSYERGSITLHSNHLLDLFDTNRVHKTSENMTPVSLDIAASSRLKEWTSTPGASIISIAGCQPNGLESSPMSILASMCVEFAINAKLPVISYFCELPSEDLRPGNTRESQELLSLTYALIRQLIEQLPVEFESDLDFSRERLTLLGGNMEYWNNAIGLFRDLVQVVPKPLFCIINGFQVLDYGSVDQFADELVKVLQGSALPASNRLKVLITTTGRSNIIVRNLSPLEIVLADRDGAIDNPGRKGGMARFIL